MSKLRRISGKNLNFEETENVPPSNPNQETPQNPNDKPHQELGFKSSKLHRTPTKPKLRNQECGVSMRTPEKHGVLARNRYGWSQDSRDEAQNGNVNLNTPRSCRTPGRTSLGFSEFNSAHNTPTKSAGKPPNPGLVYGGSCRPPVNGGLRTSNFTALTKGIPVMRNNYTTVNTVEVPRFELREDPSFWMDHNVQVLIRIRPLNGMEIRTEGYNRCLKQESAQSLTWVGNSEARFTFDHVACETIDQETLFKMVGLPMVENCLSGYNSCMFAYGQTGSGKTHTMLGEINDFEVKPSPYRGMTPRIFEFLFARIIAEEESRKDERLEYSCKCSFLEIYNEQITDLLDPSSTNLQLREDVKKGVYVENLTEYEVHTVGDILKLLSQGSANRRVAATNMNRESSRSHSVFTCVIESRWEKDSTSNLRYARLNLVDLAGSERQKTSGAEGERLKEAANINKSLSTLGLVIMALVDSANARTRHVPYRDSRLTFLLQDSLGGNSKTMIIANVSPSISSATETLNTLKFAQRAKLIQNNAVINEDASGDVMALQHQIRLLKEELAILKRHNRSRSLTFSSKDEDCSNASSIGDDEKILRVSGKQLKSLETSLNGALRREISTESCIKQLEAEIEQLNCLVRQREDENRCTKMMLKFREDKIQRMESVVSGLVPVDSYLQEENNMLIEENEILRAKVDRNPEVTRFAVENIRLLEQLKRFQDFYEEGEREMLLTEVSELRDQLVHSHQDNRMSQSMVKEAAEDKKKIGFLKSELEKSQEELDKYRDNLNSFVEENAKLCREVSDLNALLDMQKSDQDGGIEVIKEPTLDEIFGKDSEKVMDLQLEIEILMIILKEERLIHGETEEKFLSITKQYENLREELREAKTVIEALESQQLVLINELEDLKHSNKQYDEVLNEKELKMTSLNNQIIANHFPNEDSSLQEKLKKMQDSLEKAKKLNIWYQTDRASHVSNEEEKDEVRKQVEAETTDVIVSLQEELVSFQREINERILKENKTQHELTLLQEYNKELREKCAESDLLTNKIEEVLSVGHKALDDASNLLGSGKRRWVSEQLQIIARNISEKEIRIEELNSCLEDAKSRGNEMESMLRSLRGATLVVSEAHQLDCAKKDQEIDQLLIQLREKDSIASQLEEQIKVYEDELTDARLNAAQQAVESCCYLDKFIESRHNNIEADSMINKLVAEYEAMTIDIADQKRKEASFIDDDSYSVTEKQLKTYTVGEVVCLEEKLVSGFFAKELEFLIMSSKLEQVSSENNDLEKEKTSMSAVLEKFKEELVISYVNMQLKDWILVEKDAEIGVLEKEIGMQEETFKSSSCKLQRELEFKSEELRNVMFHKDENQTLVTIIEKQKDEIESLEYELYENIVKGQVLESQLNEKVGLYRECESSESRSTEIHMPKENVEDTLEAKELINEQYAETKKAMEMQIDELEVALDEKNTLIESLKEDLGSVTCERDDLHVELLRAEQLYELELTNANLNEAHQAVESSCYLDKFLETQHNVEEADSMINKLVTENKEMKIEIAELKRKEVAFINENHMLNNNYSLLEKQFKTEVEELEHMILQIQGAVDEVLVPMTSDLFEIKSRFLNSNKLMHSWCEDIWYEIIAKDWAVSVLHVCHMRILTETVAGLNAENSLLYHGLCESNSLVSQLKERNGNSIRELEACSLLRGKLLGDIKNNFDRISRKEEEVGKLSIKMTRFENKILELQGLEEAMLERSSRMGHELSMLMKEVVNENDEVLRCLEEKLVTDLSAKEIEVFIMLSKLEQLASENSDLEKACGTSKQYAVEKEEELKLYEKSVEELECTVNVLANQVEMVKGDAERQRLQREEVELELQKIRQQEQLLATENEIVKTENANNKMKLMELEDEVKKLSGQQNLQQRIHHLATIKVSSEREQTHKDDLLSSQPRQESTTCSKDPTNTTKESVTETTPQPELLPIALRKGTRACTRRRTMC